MHKITDSINSLIIETSGGIIAIWVSFCWFFIKFLKWCGKKIAEGANGDLIKKIMPNIENKLDEKISALEVKFNSKIEHLETLVVKDIQDIKLALFIYKDAKHNVEGELKTIKSVLKSGEKDLINAVLEVIRNEKY